MVVSRIPVTRCPRLLLPTHTRYIFVSTLHPMPIHVDAYARSSQPAGRVGAVKKE